MIPFCRRPVLQLNFCPDGDLSRLMIGSVQMKNSPMWSWAAAFFVSAVAAIYFGFFTEAKSPVYTTAGVFSACGLFALS